MRSVAPVGRLRVLALPRPTAAALACFVSALMCLWHTCPVHDYE